MVTPQERAPSERGHQAQNFETPEQELAYLREQVRQKQATINELKDGAETQNTPESAETSESTEAKTEAQKHQAASEAVSEYKNNPKAGPVPERQIPEDERRQFALDLAPEEHDTTIQELLWIVENRGIMNALSVAREMDRPHIDDDFHRALVQYVKSEEVQPMEKKGAHVFQALQMTLFEVLIPEDLSKEETAGGLAQLVSQMEQFYAGMSGIKKAKTGVFENFSSQREYFTIEIAVPEDEKQILFYAAIPDDHTDLFEKQITSLFPDAQINEQKDDYNIFHYEGATAASYAEETYSPLFPIKTYDQFDHDPMNVILNAFSEIAERGEGAAIQLIVAPAPKTAYYTPYKKALDDIQAGRKKVSEAIKIPKSSIGHAFHTVRDALREAKEEQQSGPVDQDAAGAITEKLETPIFETNLRLVTSCENEVRAEKLLSDLESSFHQFESPRSGGIQFKRVANRHLEQFLHQYAFRLLSEAESLPLNTKELASLCHFPTRSISSHQLKHASAKSAPAPMNTSDEGVLLGENAHRGRRQEISFDRKDRMRHFYTIGQTGTGKTTLLKNMAVQDIQNGEGVCMIDPHGNDIDEVLANVPRERIDDVIYFDPANTAEPMGLNMLEYDPNYPEQKTFVVNEMLSIFEKIYSNTPEGLGPMFQQYFRNATMLVIEDPESGSTLFDISRVLSDEEFRNYKLSRCNNPVVTQFWQEIAGKAGGDASLQNIVPFITSKTDTFLANDIMRPIVAQQESAFNFRQIMDERKILLVNLSKGRLGDINSSLIGLIIVGKILMAALSRADSLSEGDPADFFLYIDEFQNVTTNSISTILSEARKYRLSLNIAHQFIAQLDQSISDSVFGNVGSMAAFRVGSDDAQFLESQFAPTFSAADLMRVENHNALVKMLVDGSPAKPFNLSTFLPEEGRPEIVLKLKELSHVKYGRPREEVEAEIAQRYNT